MTRTVMITTAGTGGHVFAKTLEEHERNVVRWRQIEAANVAATAAAAPPAKKAP